MHPTAIWKYVNKGLFIILSIFVIASIASIIFLAHTLLKLNSLITTGSHSVKTVLLLQNFLINLDDAETGTRGYIITGNPEYLKPYNDATKRIPGNIQAIKSDPDLDITTTQIAKLQSLSDAKIRVLQTVITDKASGDEEAVQATMSKQQGRALMDEIRAQVTAISASSLQAISPRQQEARSHLRTALWVAGVLTAFVLGICVVLMWYFQRSILRERALESTKNEFLSLASHQLRTPATNVKQYVGLILEGYLGDISDKQRDALKIAYKNNESEIRIMNDLLNVAKLDLQRTQLHKQRVNVADIVRRVVKSFDSYTQTHQQTVTVQAPNELMAVVDKAYFRGVIEKLVDNAIRYSHDKTRITVRVKANTANDTFEVIVRDHGLGIEKREVAKLFNKFTRLNNEFSANTEGSGLGLYWVKQIMVLHGGSIRVVSQVDKGSTFTVRAPLFG